ncbi:hypothetical protein [Amycolatopsis methanolica]|uniref:hypothetical protein n=1 Tax=Amycolatopsis methanolica TaxID=1814 RepID=UPI000377DA54|nr:hypothetical protein [Amycolatopsis methanolica]
MAGLAALDGVVGVADGHDTCANGIISYVNESAREAGIRVGEPLSAALTRLAAGGVPC